LERRDPGRDAFGRGDGEAKTAYAERREAIGVSAGEEEWALVTGGAGFIGSEGVRQLLAIGGRARALDDLSTGKKSHWDFAADAQKAGKFELVEGDVTNYKHVEGAMKGVTYVFHLAAVSKGRPTLDPTKDDVGYAGLETNVKGTENGLRAVRARDAELARSDATSSGGRGGQRRRGRFGYAGSSTYYGNQPTPFDEERTHLRTTTTPYATTKAQGED
jgi:Nucleoside-diphosphate-sugar epimerases